MHIAKCLTVALFLCISFVSGTDAKRMSLEEDLTVLFDYQKYQEHYQSRRMKRQENFSNETELFDSSIQEPYEKPIQPEDGTRLDIGCVRDCGIKICADPVNEVYQSCGNKCVLGCRYSSTSSVIAGITLPKFDCDKNDCVEGCFCKHGLVRHQNKCIPASECPIRKCNRYEIYMCGTASPITCDNALRGGEIDELTRHVDCVWGCFCAKGYLRNNHNGKCIPESECRSSKSVEISPQIPGLFKHVPSCRPPGCVTHGNGCGPTGCAPQHHASGCGPHGCANEGVVNYPVHYPGLVHNFNRNNTAGQRPGVFNQANIPADISGNVVRPGSFNSGTPSNMVQLANGAPIMAPARPITGIVATGTIGPAVIRPGMSSGVVDEAEYDETEHDQVEDDDDIKEEDDDESDAPLAVSRPETKPIQTETTTVNSDKLPDKQESPNNIQQNMTPQIVVLNNKPQVQVQKPVDNINTMGQNIVIPIQMQSSIKDDKVPIMQNKEPQIQIPQNNANIIAPQTQSPVSPLGNNQLVINPNQQFNAPNNGNQNPSSNPFTHTPNEDYVFDPNYGYVPINLAHNPSSVSVASPGSFPFDSPDFYNLLQIPYRFQINKDKTEYYSAGDKNPNEQGTNSFQSTAPQYQNIPPKKPVQTNFEILGNRPSYQPPFINFLNQFRPNFNNRYPNNGIASNGFSFQAGVQNSPLNQFNLLNNLFNNPNSNGFQNQVNPNGFLNQGILGNKQNFVFPNRKP